MTTQQKVLVPGSQLAAAATSQYLADTVTARIEAACVVNTAGSTRLMSVHIVRPSETADVGNILIQTRGIAAGESYLCPELILQLIEPGCSLVTVCSGTGLTMTVSGVEISA